jgi:hypothetical protein
MMKIKIIFLLSLSAVLLQAAIDINNFIPIAVDIEPVRSGSCQWGDFDSDGLLDFLITGRRDTDNLYFTGLYRNLGNDEFELYSDALPGVAYGKTAWGDFDNDGDLDILLSGYNGVYNDDIVKIYRNDDGEFVSCPYSFHNKLNKAVWGDLDNDGDLDIFANSGSEGLYFLYINLGNEDFQEIEMTVEKKLRGGGVDLIDYNNDGSLDLLITGRLEDQVFSLIYENDGKAQFTVTDPGFIPVWDSENPVAVADFDNDGDSDVILGGRAEANDATSVKTKLYRNVAGNFEPVVVAFPEMSKFSPCWGDFDNDGDADLIFSGYTGSGDYVKLFQNDGNEAFVEIPDNFTNMANGSIACGDYDNDGDLDLLMTGSDRDNDTFFAQIYRNDGTNSDQPPESPANLSAEIEGQTLVLRWNSSSDVETPAAGLSYNLYVGTAENKNRILSSHTDMATGQRKIAGFGNAGQLSRKLLTGLPAGEYVWSVQAIAPNYRASKFAPEKSFVVETPKFITVTEPHSGNIFEIGDQMLIQWKSHKIEKVKILFTPDDGATWYPVISDYENSEQFLWTIPNITGDECRIKITEVSEATDKVEDVSDGIFVVSDQQPPEVSVENHAETLPLRGNKELHIHAADIAGILQVNIFYRKGGESAYSSDALTSTDGQNFLYQLSSDLVTARGLEYYIVAIDSNQNATETEIQEISIFCKDGIEAPTELHAGKSGQDYRFLSIPLIRENSTAEELLNVNPALGPYQKKHIRLYTFDSEDQQWLEYSKVNDCSVGKGMAVITTKTGVRLNSGRGTTVSISGDFVLPLSAGWNIVGNPFNHIVTAANIEFTGGLFELWHYNGKWQEATMMKPWIGYAVWAENSGNLILRSSLKNDLNKVINSSSGFISWESNIHLMVKGELSGDYAFGQLYEEGKNKKFNKHLPPLLPGQVAVAFCTPEGKFSTEYHLEKPEIDSWNFQILSTVGGEEIKLSFKNLPSLKSNGQEMILIDRDMGMAYDLSENHEIGIRTRTEAMNFQIFYGDGSQLQERLANLTVKKFELHGNFPNPFNPTTQINYSLAEQSVVKLEIYNLKGEMVETLVKDYKSAGNYSVVWNARDFSSGVYLIKMQAGNFLQYQKCMLIK